MKLPIIIAEGLDVEFFYAINDAQIEMEPIDIRDGIYKVFDAGGQRLDPVPDDSPYVGAEIIETGEDHSHQLTELLFDFYEYLGLNPEILKKMELAQLIEIGKLFFFKNFRKHHPRQT
ncbi:MAG: hypothetical protein IPL32_13470 [Chloracidobacterium sp.]|nr:hypothetical protein [Chloracidobacterium sp.]